MKACLNYLS